MRVALFLLLLISCTSDGPRNRAESDKLRPIEELPEVYQDVLADYGRGGEAWAARREEVKADPKLAAFVVDNLWLEMVRAYDSSRLARPGDLDAPFERAQNELVILQEASIPMLAQSLAVPDGVVSFLAAQTLERIGLPAEDAVLPLLEHESPDVRRRAAELLGRLPNARDEEPRVLAALAKRTEKDPEWIVRAEAARAIAARSLGAPDVEPARRILCRALADPDRAVRTRAAGGLRQLGDPLAVPALINYLERSGATGDLADLDAAQAALKSLLSVEEKKSVKEWRAIWKERLPVR